MTQQKQDVPYGFCRCGCGGRAPVAPGTQTIHGNIKGQPQRYILGHGRAKSGVHYVVEDRGYLTPCWIWQRTLNDQGYGQMAISRHTRKAHVVYYERKYGPIPENLEPDHLCKVRACVNPDHVEPITHAENIQRGRTAKLTVENVLIIRSRLATGATRHMLAEEFGVSQQQIGRIRDGASWANV